MPLEKPLAPPARLALAGCWHGNTDYARNAINYAARQGATTLIHLGDFAFMLPDFLAAVVATLTHRRMRLLLVDGNHDDHHRLAALPTHPSGTRKIAPRVWYLPRGLRWEWAGVTFLALGGAHSVDRQDPRRVPGATWWPEEQISLRDALAATSGGPVDVMLCHDCPAGVDIPGLRPGKWPEEEIRTAEQHRLLLRQVVDLVQPGVLWHSHYHQSYSATLDLTHPTAGTRTCRVEGLHRDGAWLIDNVTVGTVTELAGPALRFPNTTTK